MADIFLKVSAGDGFGIGEEDPVVTIKVSEDEWRAAFVKDENGNDQLSEKFSVLYVLPAMIVVRNSIDYKQVN